VAHGAGQPIQLRGDQHVTFSEIVDGGLELIALGDTADLLGEDLGAACGLEVPALRFEAGGLRTAAASAAPMTAATLG
jgi:hypothetical protein